MRRLGLGSAHMQSGGLFQCGTVRRWARIIKGITNDNYNIGHYLMTWFFRTMSMGQVLIFFNRNSIAMNLGEERQTELIPTDLKMVTQARQACHRHYLCFIISCRFSRLPSSELSSKPGVNSNGSESVLHTPVCMQLPLYYSVQKPSYDEGN